MVSLFYLHAERVYIPRAIAKPGAMPARWRCVSEHRVVFYGVLGAIVLRGVFSRAGAALARLDWALIALERF
jgi:hypothetical protein